MDDAHNEKIRYIERDLSQLKKDFDRHIEESKPMVNQFLVLQEHIKQLTDTTSELSENVRELSVFFGNIKWGKKVVIGLIALGGSIIGILIGIKELLK